ncbi:23S rRNA (uracil(1939)-C(5))-methyltransferase RlmD [Alkaliphilus peptidifermentans]|uniref:23S rRNA m(5)U-1939 methyltransferase n=1 Tax=Alkaliphilus peptidifermentans DSM 18978 TaxID=1120976 RepID=A0A1G5EIM6_9FIRM|nr:23S rRNA (uracil(1939)-C(5))-methyltransferase RlmD [Alkaliphilus peptidifermentans]SCY26802.1 23S rRNA m(5)U-1939 methyltransferase [Alkaliphilus peptidifermentans DSM 18978]
MKKKDTVEFIIEDTEFGGKAYGFQEGVKIKVKHGIKGQKVKAVIKKVKKNQAEGKILEVIEASHLEDQDTCNHFGDCGGCFQQSIHYDYQLQEKERNVRKLFLDAGLDNVNWLPIEGSPITYSYRNKMEFSFGDEEKGGQLALGMHKRGRHHDIVTVDECLIMDEDYRVILKTILKYFTKREIPFYHSMRHIGYLRHLVVRKAHYTGEMLVNLVTTTQLQLDINDLVEELKNLKLKGTLVGFLHTFNDNLSDTVQSDKTDTLFGRDYIIEKLLGLQFKISAFSFFQTNTLAAEKLYSIVREFLGDSDDKTVFDLYCGTGTIGQVVAPKAKEVIGIEIVEDAVKAAVENAKLNGLDNCRFIAGDVKEKIKELSEKPDLIILDPPRAGIHPQALQDIINFNTRRIVYVSCNPKTLANDLKELVNKGYIIVQAKCMDMFPHTPHVECVVLIEKK